ncbi:MAG: cupin-like domain-containing protein [Thermodesulfobacteriota bacterium]
MSIERIAAKDFSPQVWDHHYSNSIPFVLELEPSSFPCLDWSVESLKDIAQDEKYVLYEMPGGKFVTSRNDFIKHNLQMHEVCDLLLNTDNPNRFQMITEIKSNPAFFEQVQITEQLFSEIHNKIVQCNLWLNVGEFVSGFHNECFENLNLQISGTKRFVLFEPGVRDYYAKPILSGQGHTSHISDPDDYDEEKFVNFSNVKHKRHEVTLNAGDMLYLPICWWHNVHTEGDTNININVWWMNTPKSVMQFPRQFISGIVTVAYRKFTNQLY